MFGSLVHWLEHMLQNFLLNSMAGAYVPYFNMAEAYVPFISMAGAYVPLKCMAGAYVKELFLVFGSRSTRNALNSFALH